MLKRSCSTQAFSEAKLPPNFLNLPRKLSYVKTYSEISTYPASSETLRQQFKEQLGFTISSITSQDITEAVNLFTGDLFALSETAGKELVDLFNLYIHTSKATLHPTISSSSKHVCIEIQFLHGTFPFKTSSTHSFADSCTQTIGSSLLKRDQLAQHVSNLFQLATGLPEHLIYKHIIISAVRWESGTVFVNLSLSVVLGCLAVKGYTFNPKWNVLAYDKLFKRALLTTSCKHDQKDDRINRLMSSNSLPLHFVPSSYSVPNFATQKLDRPQLRRCSVASVREYCSELSGYSDDELLDFNKTNLTILEENASTYRNPQKGSNIALIGMMEILGFTVWREPMKVKESLIATVTLNEGMGLEFNLRFDQNTSPTPKRKISSI